MTTFRLAILSLLVLAMPALLLAAPKANLWEYWKQYDPNSSVTVDHSLWTDFLQRYVTRGQNGINRLDYRAVTDEDRSRLDDYLETLTRTKVSSMSRKSQNHSGSTSTTPLQLSWF